MTFLLTTEYRLRSKYSGSVGNLGKKGKREKGMTGGEATHVLSKADSNISIPRVSFFLRA